MPTKAPGKRKAGKALPGWIDAKLWFTMGGSDCPGKHYVSCNPHTDTGRIGAWCPRAGKHFYISKCEMTRMSPATRYWVQGYLHGQEPEPPRPQNPRVGIWYPSTHPTHRRWIEAARLFQQTGVWNQARRYCKGCRTRLFESWVGHVCATCRSSKKTMQRIARQERLQLPKKYRMSMREKRAFFRESKQWLAERRQAGRSG